MSAARGDFASERIRGTGGGSRSSEGAGRALLLFCRTPGEEAAKTRLAASFGPTATAIYEACLLDLIAAAVENQASSVVLCCSPAGSAERLHSWLTAFGSGTAADGSPLPIWPQQGDGLGQRMGSALDQAFRAGFEAAAIVGTDLPGLPPGILRACWEQLETADVVFGPALDGGFYLVALKQGAGESGAARLFEGVRWSTPDTLRQALAAVRRRDLNVSLLPLWLDLDVEEDVTAALRLLRVYQAAGCGFAPRTLGVLENLNRVP